MKTTMKSLVIISVCVMVTVDMLTVTPSSEEPNEELDPHDMLRYDSASKSMLHQEKRPSKIMGRYEEVDHFDKRIATSNVADQTKQPHNEEHAQPKTGLDLTKKHVDVSRAVYNVACVCECADCEAYFYKRFINYLLNNFQDKNIDEGNDEVFDVKVKISKRDFSTLQKYVSTNSKVALSDIDDILTHLFQSVRVANSYFSFQLGVPWTSHLIDWITDNIFFVGAIVILIFTWRLIPYLTPYGIFILGMMVIFSISVGFEYIHMFQKREAEKFADRVKFSGVPEECDPKSTSTWKLLLWSFKINFLQLKDPCKHYFEAVMIDTRFEITPMMAVASMIGRVSEVVAKYFGSSLGLFYVHLLDQFSFITRLILIIAGTAIILFFIRYIGGPSIRAISWWYSTERNRIQDVNTNNNHGQSANSLEAAASTHPTTINQYYLMSSNGSSVCTCTAHADAETVTQATLQLATDLERIQNLGTSDDNVFTCSKCAKPSQCTSTNVNHDTEEPGKDQTSSLIDDCISECETKTDKLLASPE